MIRQLDIESFRSVRRLCLPMYGPLGDPVDKFVITGTGKTTVLEACYAGLGYPMKDHYGTFSLSGTNSRGQFVAHQDMRYYVPHEPWLKCLYLPSNRAPLDAETKCENLEMLNSVWQKFFSGRIVTYRTMLRLDTLDMACTFDYLSSSEQALLGMAIPILEQQPDVVLIDEPELHFTYMHHGQLLSQLHRCAPRAQFVMATQSLDIYGRMRSFERHWLESSQ